MPGPPPTLIHQFSLDDGTGAAYVASGEVEGRLLNQFAMSEYNGDLRVATTTDNWGNFGDQSESTVYVLRPSGADLEQISSISGLGKGEQIYSVRFIDDVGYVVTFRQVDPLYVLDLSDPANPVLDGELKIPGYSAYLHPVGDGLLLGVGQDATDEGRTTGTQLSLFDVSDPANPQRISTLPIGGQSEVEWDHKAFLFWEPDGTIVLPVSPGWSDCGPAVDCLAKGISGAGGGAVVAELDGRELDGSRHDQPRRLEQPLLEPAAAIHRDRRRARHRRPRPDEVQRSPIPRSPRLGVVGQTPSSTAAPGTPKADVRTVPGTVRTSGALLDVGPLVAEADRAVEQQRLVGVGGEVAQAARTARPGRARRRPRAGSTLAPTSTSRESRLRSSNASPVASPGTGAANRRSYRHTVASIACAADAQCIVDFTLRPSGALPPCVSGS